MKVLITGAHGFVGRNLAAHLRLQPDLSIVEFTRSSSWSELQHSVSEIDFVFHLAGVNRPRELAEFKAGNVDLTRQLCELLATSGKNIPVVFASSIQAGTDNPYGASKREAEQTILDYANATGAAVAVFRLPNVFGKWCRPNYNSVVATFCHNIARNLPIRVDDPATALKLVYVDDVVTAFLEVLRQGVGGELFRSVPVEYDITLGALADQLHAFRSSRESLVSEHVGVGLTRALYATYVSYLPKEQFAYEVPRYGDPRGEFVEMLKTPDAGQFSYFTAYPGITRGGHYHHSKTEKFLVIRGEAKFRFRHVITGETHEILTRGGTPQIVETIPGWTHDITNVGVEEMIVMLWANEIFDRLRPDTYACPV